jgi:hypothetical protein
MGNGDESAYEINGVVVGVCPKPNDIALFCQLTQIQRELVDEHISLAGSVACFTCWLLLDMVQVPP